VPDGFICFPRALMQAARRWKLLRRLATRARPIAAHPIQRRHFSMTRTPRQKRVLLVCMANICRSPMARGVLEQRIAEAGLANRISVDAAGTHAYRLGQPPDPRAIEAAAARGLDISAFRARLVELGDFERFDHILAMDRNNLSELGFLAHAHQAPKIRLLMSYAPHLKVLDIPDPYGRDRERFERALDLIEAGARGFLHSLRAEVES
jgi:protein-tyrosine phosphatase